MRDFIVSIRNISKERYEATTVQRSEKKIQQAVIQGLNEDLIVLTSAFEWSLVSKMELAASKTVSGTNVLLLDYKHFD